MPAPGRALSCPVPALLVLALSIAVPRNSAAADSPSDESVVEQRRTEAKSKYQEGVTAYERRRYKDAVDLFLAADRLLPSAPLSFNIARAYERLGDDSSALRWYRDYLRRDLAAPNADAVRETVAELAAALAQKGVQQVSVFSTPAGATVSIDDQPVGVTPWTGDLALGKHRVLLSYRGRRDAARDLELGAVEPLDLEVQMEPAPTPAEPTAPPSAAASPPPQAPLAAPAPAPGGKKLGPWPWVTLGAGAAALGGSLTFEMLRRSSESEAEGERTQLGFQSAIDAMESRKTTARVLLGVGGAVVIAGGVLLLLDGSSAPRNQVGFGCVPDGCALNLGSRF